jgi:uncharacterized membrane protein HdeD (DUF308 family)
MATLEELAQDLYHGQTHVQVPKDKVEPLSDAWKVSKVNVPHKGSKGSYRNGRLHAHDMGDHYDVHLDRVDPSEHGFRHLVQDAPLVFFFWTQFSDAGRSLADVKGTREGMQADKWAMRVALGSVMVVLGLVVATEPVLTLGLVVLALVIALVAVAALSFASAARGGSRGKLWMDVAMGAVALMFAAIVFVYPEFALSMLFLVLTIWTLGSALFLMFGRGEKLLFPRGSAVPFVFGMLSLVLAIILLLDPSTGVELVIFVAGIMICFIGLMQVVVGLLMRSAGRAVAKEKA